MNIVPAASFTAATTAPAVIGSALDLLDFLGRHLLWLGGTLTAAALVLVVWSSARESARQASINAADRQWSATGRPVAGWAPGWAWSGFSPDPEDDEAEDQAEEEALPPAACQSCHTGTATVTVAVEGGPTFHLCSTCSPVATVLGRAS